jgi:hypothetical protein
MTKTKEAKIAVDDLHQKPLITMGVLGQAFAVGPYRIKGVAHKLGLKPHSMMNGREMLSFEQAQQIVREMKKAN